MDKNQEIMKLAVALSQEILDLQTKLATKQGMLESLQNICEHPTVEMYRGREINSCGFCTKQFMHREAVDRIFSDVR